MVFYDSLWFYDVFITMDKRKKEDNTFLRKNSHNKLLKRNLNANGFNMFLAMWQLCKVWWFYFSVCCNIDVNSALGENSKKSLSSAISTEASFDDDSNEKSLNVKNVCQQ